MQFVLLTGCWKRISKNRTLVSQNRNILYFCHLLIIYQLMIHRRRSNIVLFLCLQAMAVAIICLGSLINFHQYKIWGKPLIPNFVGYKRDIEKYSKILSFSKLTRENQNLQKYFSGNDCDLPSEIRYASNVWGGLFSFELCQCFPVSNRVSSCGLRGPPISWISTCTVRPWWGIEQQRSITSFISTHWKMIKFWGFTYPPVPRSTCSLVHLFTI